jgi:hypothetical protein
MERTISPGSSLHLPAFRQNVGIFYSLVITALLLTGCVPSEISDLVGTTNPYADTSIIPTRDRKTLKWGYLEDGNWVIPPKFDSACAFLDKPFAKHDGQAMIQLGGKNYFINKSGEIVSEVPFPYHPDSD